ncbi:unnamed protein product [Triticum turgidum subsp. durum]|uniref:histidine kinase n=1 Tax=Triticum turgidum subsp. durum TaxID=4567 RepID=A0A9R0YRF9_TRITD|nr:unnamed protein product [Triticum turgidum subsp. durum]
MLQCQKVSDFLIAASYLSIPLELLYFASCADLAPVKWLLLQLAAFAVLGGSVHLLAVLTHHHPHSSGLLLASTAAKLLAALVSLATALSLLTFIPRLIRAKLREALLRAKARQLDRDVGLIRRRVEATSRVVRMLSRHIRDSPHDHHAILHTTMLHLADALALHSCAVWVPVPGDVLQLVYQLSLRDKGAVVLGSQAPIPADDPDVVDVMSGVAAKVLRPGSWLVAASGGGLQPPGGVAAIRMPMLKVSNFDGGRTPVASSYAILVLVLPDTGRWSSQDLEIVEVVADQVAVALSHAAVLEEWQSIRDRLADQHRALLHAKHEAATATTGIHSVQSAMCGAMQRQMHSLSGCSGVEFSHHPENSLPLPLPEWVVGDETRVFHLLLHMLATLLGRRCDGAAPGRLTFSVESCNVGEEERYSRDWIPMRPSTGCSMRVKFQVGMQTRSRTKFPHGSASSNVGPSFGMCNKIVQMMKGSMRSSGSDGGSIITVVLQFQLQQSGARRRTSTPPVPVPRFDGLRVLLADSDGTSRQVTEMLLEKLGCQVMPVPSGAHCIRLLESAGSCFQLVLLDLDKHAATTSMEDVFKVALQIGELGSGGWLLVLAALAVVDDRVRDACQRSGINCVIQKPIRLVALGAQLAAALQNN